MTDTKHTPGPWESDRGFRDTFNHASGHSTVEDDFLTIFCGEESFSNFDPSKHNWVEVYGSNQEANAALIAAAPDMLAALKEMFRYMGSEGYFPAAGKIACDAARAAIAKATGEVALSKGKS